MIRIVYYLLPVLFLGACSGSQSINDLIGKSAELHPIDEEEHNSLVSQGHSQGADSNPIRSLFGGGRGGPASSGSLSVDQDGIIKGPNVNYVFNKALQGPRFPANNPRAIVLHKTAGMTCQTRNGKKTVSAAYAKPHIYICQDGSIVVNGSLDYQRRSAEAGHNDYTINIEFESPYLARGKEACAKRGHILPPGVEHCYYPLTSSQLASGKQALQLISKYHNIPLKSVISPNQRMNYGAFVNAFSGAGIHKSQVRGVLESYQTRKGYHDSSNHDDHLEKGALEFLGVAFMNIKEILFEGLRYLYG